MTLSDTTKSPSFYERYHQKGKVDGVQEEQGLSDTRNDVICEQGSKNSSLRVTALERRQNLTDKDRSGTSSPLAGQNAPTINEHKHIQELSRNQNNGTFSSEDGNCESVGASVRHTDGEKEHKQKHDSDGKGDETSTKSVHCRSLTEEEKIQERSRKGRERSLRTRRRNIARLKLLEENCVHYSKENKVLRELARSLEKQDTERAIELFKQYKVLEEGKPEPHKLSQSESYYMDLLSPLSVTASTATGETDSKAAKATKTVLKTEHSLIPCTYKGLLNRQNSEAPQVPHSSQEVKTPLAQSAPPEMSHVSIGGEKHVTSVDDFHSVFADPTYCDEKYFEFTLEDIHKQPPLSAEEIVDLLEEGRKFVEQPDL